MQKYTNTSLLVRDYEIRMLYLIFRGVILKRYFIFLYLLKLLQYGKIKEDSSINKNYYNTIYLLLS